MLGRRTKRILPKDTTESTFLTESLQYDEWGNLWKRTDFAGKTTTFGYDALNRLKSKTADPTHASLTYGHAIAKIEFDYDANGARTAARTFNASNTQLYAETTPRDERSRIDYKDTSGGRLDYSYYANNLLKDVVSSNSGGVNIGYRYDELNRLESVDDTSTGLPTRTSAYSYNANGSLETMTQPNGVMHTYGYDALNRLRGLVVARGTTLLHSYEYKLRPSGHRREIVENSSRTTTYTYDDLYRLTSESIANDANANNGDIGYSLDKVGNRSSRLSSLASVQNQTNGFNARDWLNGDSYDSNGNTKVGRTVLGEPPGTDIYDFENRLILRTKSDGTTINLSYDADGHRIAKNVFNASAQPVSSTTWLVDTNNLTGYCQVFEERVTTGGPTPSSILRVYTYGSSLISQAVSLNSQPSTLSYYATDGHGNIRELTDASGSITDRYDYEAFGNLVFQSGTTANAYRYSGEQYDADLGLYYLRARYLNTDLGRFWSMDSYEGDSDDPHSLHKYLYTSANPVTFIDPSGEFALVEVAASTAIVGLLNAIALPRVQELVGGAVGAGKGERYSLSSLGVYDEVTDLMDAFGLDAEDFSGNLFADAAAYMGTEAVMAAVSAGGGKILSKGFSALRKKKSCPPGITMTIGALRAAKLADAHHIIQDAAVKHLPNYDSEKARGVRLGGPSNVRGTQHHATRAVQRQPGGGTYGAERRIGYKALRKSGYSAFDARCAVEEADAFFQSIGVKKSTPTRIPGDRRKP
jgi:RHS repeat-associated protein